jgi:DNA repair ATPase RecN
MDAPRSLITMNMDLERKVFESFMSTLQLSEHGSDDQGCIVSLTLGELRQHVQWCQYAAQLVDQAAANNSHQLKVERELGRTKRMLADYEKLEPDLAQIQARMNNLKGAIENFNVVRADLIRVRKDAKTNP